MGIATAGLLVRGASWGVGRMICWSLLGRASAGSNRFGEKEQQAHNVLGLMIGNATMRWVEVEEVNEIAQLRLAGVADPWSVVPDGGLGGELHLG